MHSFHHKILNRKSIVPEQYKIRLSNLKDISTQKEECHVSKCYWCHQHNIHHSHGYQHRHRLRLSNTRRQFNGMPTARLVVSMTHIANKFERVHGCPCTVRSKINKFEYVQGWGTVQAGHVQRRAGATEIT